MKAIAEGPVRVREVIEQTARVAFFLLALALPWSVAPMSIALVLCGVLTLGVWFMPGGSRWVRTPVDLPALLWIAALMLASTFAVDPAASWPRVTKGFLLLLVPVAAYHAREEKTARIAVAVLLVSAGVAAVFALARFAAYGPAFPNRVKGAVGHPLTYGGQALLLSAVAAAIAIRLQGKWRVGALAVLALLLAALAGTYTRSAWIGATLAFAIIVALTRARLLPVFAAGLVPVVLLAQGVYRSRMLSIIDPANAWNRERLHMWDAGVRMLGDHPWTGVGLQDLHSLYERYRPPESIEPVGHLHSVYINVAASMGIIGLVALAVLLAALLWAGSRGLRRSDSRFAAALSLGVTAGLVGFMAAGLFEWNLGDEELLDLLYVMVGIAFAASSWKVIPSAQARTDAESIGPERQVLPSEELAASSRG